MSVKADVLTGTDEQIEAVRSELLNRHGIVPIQVDVEPSEELLKEAGRRGLYLYRVGPGGFPVDHCVNSVRKIRVRLARMYGIETLVEALYRFVRFHTQTPGSVIRNFASCRRYMNLFEKLMGRRPTSVLEIGHNEDVIGQAIACKVEGIPFAGVTLRSGPVAQFGPVRRVLQRLEVDITSAPHEAQFETLFEQSSVKGPFDLVFDVVVLEHVHDHEAYFDKVASVLSPCSLYISDVGLDAHSFGTHPLDHLRLSEEEWAKEVHSRHLPRRLLADDYPKLMRKAGLRPKTEVRKRVDVPEDIQARYPGRDLSPIMVRYICRLRQSS